VRTLGKIAKWLGESAIAVLIVVTITCLAVLAAEHLGASKFQQGVITGALALILARGINVTITTKGAKP
jgi:hypothetical protein